MEKAETGLSIFYTDDSGHTQGPFAATLVLKWYKDGFFSDKHAMRITDNGQKIGDSITITKTLGELKHVFGEQSPIPTKAEDIGFRTFSLAPVSRRQAGSPIKSKPVSFSFKKEPLPIKDLEDRNEVYPGHLLDENKILLHPSQSRIADPAVPKVTRRRHRRSSSVQSDSSVAEQVSKRSKTANSRSNDNVQVISQSFKNSSELSSYTKRKFALPFYSGDNNKDNKRLDTIVAVELAAFLHSEYSKLDKRQREELHRIYAKLKLPERCDMCEREMKLPANFLTHVLSTGHIQKSTENKTRRFTFESDYLLLKNDIEKVKKSTLLKPEKPSSSHSTSVQQPPKNTTFHTNKNSLKQERCTQS